MPQGPTRAQSRRSKMNPTPSTSSSTGGSSSNQRKERGAIAAQACDTCRARKQRCDEARPKCGLCSRMKLDCNYREPQPTKKDKTLVEILDRLTAIESKLETLPVGSSQPGYGPTQASHPAVQSSYGGMPQQSSYASQLSRQLEQPTMEQSPQLSPLRIVGNNSSGSNNLFEFQGDVWAYVQTLEAQIRELQARLARVEREKDNLVGQLEDKSSAMEM